MSFCACVAGSGRSRVRGGLFFYSIDSGRKGRLTSQGGHEGQRCFNLVLRSQWDTLRGSGDTGREHRAAGAEVEPPEGQGSWEEGTGARVGLSPSEALPSAASGGSGRTWWVT